MARRLRLSVFTAAAVLGLAAGCSGTTSGVNTAGVYGDSFNSANYQAFGNSDLTALGQDTSEKHSGSASLKVSVPGPGSYAGGAVVASTPRDLSGFNALTFWAKASGAATIDVVGLGNDNTGTDPWDAHVNALPLTTTWTKYVIPIPLPSKLTLEKGLFYFAASSTGVSPQAAWTFWLDDINFEALDAATLGAARPAIDAATVTAGLGAPAAVTGTKVTFAVSGADVVVNAAPAYFTFAASPAGVVTVGSDGAVTPVGTTGTAHVTAKLGTVDAAGELTVNVASPTTAAPTPTYDAADVLSLFSGAYTNVAVDTWGTTWSNNGAGAHETDVTIAGNAAKAYARLLFAGIEFTGAHSLDVTAMTHFHVDVWATPDATVFKVKLVDFGADNAFGGGDDTESELTFDAGSTPALATGQWMTLDLPLSAFTGLTTRAHLSQIVISSSTANVYLDNVLFRKEPAPPPPTVLVVFDDAYGAGISFAQFGGSTNDVGVDSTTAHTGTSSLKFVVPTSNYTGGALVDATPQDLHAFDAVTFWAKADQAYTLDKVGYGNDAATTTYAAELLNLPLTTTWTQFVVPLVGPSLRASAVGLFHFATGGNAAAPTVWLDQIQYETLGSGVVGPVTGAIATETVGLTTGATQPVHGLSATAQVNGSPVTLVNLGGRTFTWSSDNEAAATVDADGIIHAVAPGTANVTAKLEGVATNGVTTVNVSAPVIPTDLAPVPSFPPSSVISLYTSSGTYTDHAVDEWLAVWSNATEADVTVAGKTVKKYTYPAGGFAGIETITSGVIDATSMGAFHVSIWTPDATTYRVKLVDFGPNGVYDGGGDDTAAELTFDSTTTPALTQGGWVELDIPFTAFLAVNPGLQFAHMAQYILSTDSATVYVDNVFFHQ